MRTGNMSQLFLRIATMALRVGITSDSAVAVRRQLHTGYQLKGWLLVALVMPTQNWRSRVAIRGLISSLPFNIIHCPLHHGPAGNKGPGLRWNRQNFLPGAPPYRGSLNAATET